ncbi:MAG TPA: hypothetical protein VGK99_23460 [Acidobacteriota bacterium]
MSSDREPFRPSDLFLAAEISDEAVFAYLRSIGFRDPGAADRNLQLMADDYSARHALGAMAEPLMDSLSRAPDPDKALLGMERYLSARTGRTNFINYLNEDPEALDLLTTVLGSSPFLSELLIRNPEYFHWLRYEYDRAHYETVDYADDIDSLLENLANRQSRLDALKRFRRQQTLRIATLDMLGKISLESATLQLSQLAEMTLQRALAITIEAIAPEARLSVLQPPAKTRGRRAAQAWDQETQIQIAGMLAVIGMGKLGGSELNYSSDIDLIYVYEPLDPSPQCEQFFQKLFRDYTQVLSEYTSEGYLYRVDLRLRPMGKAGAIANSLQQHRHYYEHWGDTFERFALIKARGVAGDETLTRRFLALVQPFVYRKYLDHAALEEIISIKARADAETERRSDSSMNVKTGRGGIREIELFTQILQILYGGSNPELQDTNTIGGLSRLRQHGIISEATCQDLTEAYTFLRTVEHRLQIVQEQQVHSVPADPIEREITARRMGYTSAETFDRALAAHRDRVHEIYQSLLKEKGAAAGASTRVFLRMLNEELPESEMLQVLEKYGFVDPVAAAAEVRNLVQMPSLAHSQTESRTLLANFLPIALERAARCAEPVAVLNRLEQIAQSTGAAPALLRSLLENEALREQLLSLLDSGRMMPERLIRFPELIDSLLHTPLTVEELHANWQTALDEISTAALDEKKLYLRRLKQVEEFKIVGAWLSAAISLEELQQRLSLLAECCVAAATGWLSATAAGSRERRRAGVRPRSAKGAGALRRMPAAASKRAAAVPEWTVLALGKLGSRELTIHSDLDLVFLYQGKSSDSHTFMYYQQFVQDVQKFLEDPTPAGAAYKIDTRLRPEGNKGALAMPAESFKKYLQARAEKWERLAWTRARFSAGSEKLARQLLAWAEEFVYDDWDPDLPLFMRAVRSRMEAELSGEISGRLNFKTGMGGLSDLDFMLQMIQIREGARNPAFRRQGTHKLLSLIEEFRILSHQERDLLQQACTFLRRLEIWVRLDADANINWIANDPAACNTLGKRMQMPSPEGANLLRSYKEITTGVRALYEDVTRRLQG